MQAKWYLIREKLIELEKLEVTDEDYLKIAKENSGRYNIPEGKLVEAYKGNEDVKLSILNDKVLDMIISNADVNETEHVMKKENENIAED